ncbi:MAG TPA: hypothetical protein VFJ20_03755, partial [Gemmatimonadaceae bacterium]|nr:hypothetical protein [Gemmatimonadaceae bacterium]
MGLSTILVAAICCASPSGGRQATPKPRATATAVVRQGRAIWTKQHARAWADSAGWLVGSNFIPSSAINQLEMWQSDTFDPRTIDREL